MLTVDEMNARGMLLHPRPQSSELAVYGNQPHRLTIEAFSVAKLLEPRLASLPRQCATPALSSAQLTFPPCSVLHDPQDVAQKVSIAKLDGWPAVPDDF